MNIYFQMMFEGAVIEKAHLPTFSLVLGIGSCSNVDDLSCLGKFDSK